MNWEDFCPENLRPVVVPDVNHDHFQRLVELLQIEKGEVSRDLSGLVE